VWRVSPHAQQRWRGRAAQERRKRQTLIPMKREQVRTCADRQAAGGHVEVLLEHVLARRVSRRGARTSRRGQHPSCTCPPVEREREGGAREERERRGTKWRKGRKRLVTYGRTWSCHTFQQLAFWADRPSRRRWGCRALERDNSTSRPVPCITTR